MGGSEIPENNGEHCKKLQKRKGKGQDPKKRFHLFDPSCKTDLENFCDDGLVLLQLEEDRESGETGREKDSDQSISLDFDGGSSDEDDKLENLPLDDNKLKNEENLKSRRQVQQPRGLFCGSCNVSFSDLHEQRFHCTLDWHRYNVKRRLNGQDFVSEGKFDGMIDDLSSIDGSDDEEEDVVGAAVQPVERLLEKLNIESSDKSVAENTHVEQARLSSSQKLEKSPKIFFKNKKGKIISCFKTVLSCQTVDPSHQDETKDGLCAKFVNSIKNPMRITIIMASGGHFGAAVFEGNTCTHHKTFHSYTVRAKQGGSQGSHDSKSGTSNAKSAGASLRRYNQQSFTQHVQDLLASWKGNIAGSNLVFYKAVSANANVLFTGKNPPLSRDSKSLRTIPFPTKRPTFSEVKRVHSLLTTVHLYDSMDSFLEAHSSLVKNDQKKNMTSPPKQRNKTKVIDRAKSRSPKRKDQLDIYEASDSGDANNEIIETLVEVEQAVDFNELKEFDDSLTPEQRREGRNRKKKNKKVATTFKLEGILADLRTAMEQNGLENIKTLLTKFKADGQTAEINQPVDLQSSTLLHLAAKSNQLEVIWSLMEAGCDPAIKDKCGKYPYNYAETKECREIFRKYMGDYPDKYDYKKAQVPPPLSEEAEKERAEKKKLLNKMKREKEKLKKTEKKEKEKETEEQRRFLNLSDREKRALAAEQRILAQCKKNSEKAPILVRCFECATDITGKVPFEYNQNVFCSTKCLTIHRKKCHTPLSVG